MSHILLHEIEAQIDRLSSAEKQTLLQRLTQKLCSNHVADDITTRLARMAADPDIQREMREIERDFAPAAEDGLEGV